MLVTLDNTVITIYAKWQVMQASLQLSTIQKLGWTYTFPWKWRPLRNVSWVQWHAIQQQHARAVAPSCVSVDPHLPFLVYSEKCSPMCLLQFYFTVSLQELLNLSAHFIVPTILLVTTVSMSLLRLVVFASILHRKKNHLRA